LGEVEVWDLEHGQREITGPDRGPLGVGRLGNVLGLEVSPDGEILYTLRSGVTPAQRNLTATSLKTGEPVFPPRVRPTQLYSFAMSPDGRHLAIGTSTGLIEIWATE
jgi:WD40 repeat protein